MSPVEACTAPPPASFSEIDRQLATEREGIIHDHID